MVATAIAAGMLPAMHPLLGDSIRNGVLLLPVVLLVGVYAGINAGLVCIGISTAALLWYGRDSAHGAFPTGLVIAESAAFALIATAILWLGGSRHRAQKQFAAASEASEDEIARLRAEVDEQRQIDEALQHSQLG